MLSINLISEQLKKEIKLRNIYNVSRKVNYILSIIIVLSATALVVSKGIMQESFNKIVSDSTLVTKNTQSYNTKVKEINTKLSAVNQIQDEYVPWCFMLDKISQIMPGDVALSSLKLNQQDQSMVITGFALSRSGLLSLKDAMEKDATFKNFDFPLKNILQKDNIDFNIKANVDLKAIKDNLGYDNR